MAWVEMRGGDFLNLDHVMALHAELSPVDGEEWVVSAVLSPNETVQLDGSWPDEKHAKEWIRQALLGAGEKIVGHVLIRRT